MKKLINSLLLVLMLCGIVSCKNDLDPLESGNHRSQRLKEKPMVKTIRMSFGGDYITEFEEPLLRADDGETYVGINVFYTDKDDETQTEMKYAYGLFRSADNLSIDLITGYTYRFVATILIEREDKLWDNGTSNLGEPFITNNGDGYFPKSDITGEFIYTYEAESDAKFYFTKLSRGTALVDAGDALPSQYGDVRFPRVKRFYGSINSFDPSLLAEVDINMEYKCFGLKLVLKSIPETTSVSVMDITNNGSNITTSKNPEYYLRFPSGLTLSSSSEDSKIYDGLYSLNNLEVDTKQFTLRFTWHKGHGQTETFDHSVTVEAKKKKVLEISIEGEVDETKSGNIILSNRDDTLTVEDPETVSYSNNKKG